MKITIYFNNDDYIYHYENVKSYINHDDFIRFTNESENLLLIETIQINKSHIKKIEMEII